MQAGVYVDRAVEHFASDPVYVDPAAKPTLSAAEADRLRNEIGQVNAGPVYIAKSIILLARTFSGSQFSAGFCISGRLCP